MAIEYGILTEPSSLSTNTNKYEMGWAFTIGDEDVRVVGLRAKFPAAQSTVGHLWSSDGSLLASCEIVVESAATWAEAYFSEPVILSSGKQYVISCYNNSSRYSNYTSAFTFSEYFASIQGGRYVSSANKFPTGTEPNYIYPLIDVIIKQSIVHVPYGTAEFVTDVARRVSSVKTSYIEWDADIPESTTLKVYSKLSTGEYELCDNKGTIVGVISGMDLREEALYLKVEMTTSDPVVTPVLKRMRVQIMDQTDVNAIVLMLDSGSTKSIQRAIGDITVSYDGSGTLVGEGGPVLAFERTFTPEGLDPKNNPHVAEHIEIASIVSNGTLTRIYYTNTTESEHIDLTDISAVGVLTRIDDI